MKLFVRSIVSASILALGSSAAFAAEFIPDLSQPVDLQSTTTFEIKMREQAKLEVPAFVLFDVVDVAKDTPQNGVADLMAKDIVLAPGHKLLVQIAATSDSFADQAGKPSYSASNVTWQHGAVQGGSGIDGNLGKANEYRDIMVCSAGGPCESAELKFTLVADPTQSVAGGHVLVGTYRASSIQ